MGTISSRFLACGLGCLLMLAGCITLPRVDEALQTLRATPSCCSGLDRLPYQFLPVGHARTHEIDRASPAFQFPEGKSYFLAFRIAEPDKALRLYVGSYYAGDIFMPMLTLLDERFDVVRQVQAGEFQRVEARGRYQFGNTLQLEPGDSVRYLIVHTPSNELGRFHDTPTVGTGVMAGGVVAMSGGGAMRRNHSPFGKIRVELSDR
ncbi:MAG: hypothetical protein KF823_01200 [Xanthomonadales bacterium]|nr:hypothetical protein [Xanthomonadales bacterium]